MKLLVLPTRFSAALLLGVTLLLGACSGDIKKEERYPTADRRIVGNDIYKKPKGLFGSEGIKILGGDDKPGTDVITVNSYLWRAALDTVSFMPISTVDPFGGVILTDWYSNTNTPDERYKLNIFVIGSQLRSDGIKATMFKQRRSKAGWRDVAVDDSNNTAIEDAILKRARELRVAARDAEGDD